MKILFIVSAFREDQLKLQPWLTIDRVGKHFDSQGDEVHIITDCSSEPVRPFYIHRVDTLRSREAQKIESLIHRIDPDKVIVFVSPLSLLTASWYHIFAQYDAYGFMSNAFYTPAEFLKAIPHLALQDIIGFGRQAVVPEFIWTSKLKKWFKGVICQSVNTKERMQAALKKGYPVWFIPPGIDLDLWTMKTLQQEKKQEEVFLYAGSLKKIRGYHLLLKAFSMLLKPKARLVVLARGADEKAVRKIKCRIETYGIKERVRVVGGWIDEVRFKEYIQEATAVLLPFVLVPSELPVTVMESIACGTPVVVSRIDGLPSAAGKAGFIIAHADWDGLAKAIDCLSTDRGVLSELEKACKIVRSEMISWNQAAERLKKVLVK